MEINSPFLALVVFIPRESSHGTHCRQGRWQKRRAGPNITVKAKHYAPTRNKSSEVHSLRVS